MATFGFCYCSFLCEPSQPHFFLSLLPKKEGEGKLGYFRLLSRTNAATAMTATAATLIARAISVVINGVSTVASVTSIDSGCVGSSV